MNGYFVSVETLAAPVLHAILKGRPLKLIFNNISINLSETDIKSEKSSLGGHKSLFRLSDGRFSLIHILDLLNNVFGGLRLLPLSTIDSLGAEIFDLAIIHFSSSSSYLNLF